MLFCFLFTRKWNLQEYFGFQLFSFCFQVFVRQLQKEEESAPRMILRCAFKLQEQPLHLIQLATVVDKRKNLEQCNNGTSDLCGEGDP